MTAMQHWTTGQWVVFGLTIVVALGAVTLAYVARSAVLGWTAPAPMRIAPSSTPRPSLVLAERRAIAARHAPAMAITAGWIEPARQVPIIVGDSPTALPVQHDPMTLDYSSHGPGALRDLLEVVADPALKTSAEIAAEESAWINAYADLSGMMPETDKVRESMRVAIEPAMRTARLWLMRAGETGARAVLADWRINTDTGEIRNPFAITPRSVARALLVS